MRKQQTETFREILGASGKSLKRIAKISAATKGKSNTIL